MKYDKLAREFKKYYGKEVFGITVIENTPHIHLSNKEFERLSKGQRLIGYKSDLGYIHVFFEVKGIGYVTIYPISFFEGGSNVE